MKRRKGVLGLSMVILMVWVLVPIVWAQGVDKVNINKASVEQLMELKGIGQKYAEKIVTYRENNGPFQKPEDIVKVQGIGQRALEVNKDRIAVE
jgi:competence protein ComEA